jgi:hypothetical protein
VKCQVETQERVGAGPADERQDPVQCMFHLPFFTRSVAGDGKRSDCHGMEAQNLEIESGNWEVGKFPSLFITSTTRNRQHGSEPCLLWVNYW